MVVLCGQNDYVIRRAYRRAQPVVGVVRIDQTVHIILCTFFGHHAALLMPRPKIGISMS
jgi:hypothetical protein